MKVLCRVEVRETEVTVVVSGRLIKNLITF